MKFEAELNFVKDLLSNFHLTFTTVQKTSDLPFLSLDLGLRQLLFPDLDYRKISENLEHTCLPNTIYRMKDLSLCNYLFFLIPDEHEKIYAIIGPYTLTAVSPQNLPDIFASLSCPAKLLPQLEKYYQEVPFLTDESRLLTLLYTLGSRLWGDADHFSFQDISDFTMADYHFPAAETDSSDLSEPFLSMQVLEKRYSDENELIKAVAAGQSHKADVLLNNFTSRQMEQRSTDLLRNAKNYSIILNTLLRKAVESAAVHPLHIDSISARYARKIELCVSLKSIEVLNRDMVHHYCLLVQNHSMQGYSLLVRKILTQIDSDLTADLSLSAQAKLLNINSSYLSSLFKKETGNTLTEYVNRKRIRHAVFLLNTTPMQIQVIAQHCGIPDVNYFAKTFKKYIGTTPKEYRDSIRDKTRKA